MPGSDAPVLSHRKLQDDPIKIVFFLSVQSRALRQIQQLFRMIYDRGHYYYIHVDLVSCLWSDQIISLSLHFLFIHLNLIYNYSILLWKEIEYQLAWLGAEHLMFLHLNFFSASRQSCARLFFWFSHFVHENIGQIVKKYFSFIFSK